MSENHMVIIKSQYKYRGFCVEDKYTTYLTLDTCNTISYKVKYIDDLTNGLMIVQSAQSVLKMLTMNII